MSSDRGGRRHYGLTLHVLEEGTHSSSSSNTHGLVARVGTEIIFDPAILDTYHYEGWNPIHYDLLLVCAAVEFADRRRTRRATQWSRRFQVIVPVLELDAWERIDVRKYLHDTLRYLTGDDWQFCFRQAENSEAEHGGRQRVLPFPNNKRFVIAYSNGIDSRCVSSLFDDEDSGIRVRVSKHKDRKKQGERPFDQVPFAVQVTSAGQSDVRSRGFKFAAITAIAGHLSGVSRIIVPESGQGAIGPFLRPLHNTYADYRNHPSFFRRMERFIRVLLGYSVCYEQPQLWKTKGETIGAFLAQAQERRVTLMNTRSCWQQRWNARFDGKLRQCGLCAACLLRRMSMFAVEVEEPAGTYTFHDLTKARYEEAIPPNGSRRLSRTMVEYGTVGAGHLQQLSDMAELSDRGLRPYVFDIARTTRMSEQETGDALRRLLLQHSAEWRAFRDAQGRRSFIKNWTKGAHHSGLE